MRFAIAMILATVSSLALASPDCSNAGAKPSSECAAKIEMCFHDSVVYVLAVRNRAAGLSESENFSRIAGNGNREVWYVKHSDDVRSIVHQLYANDAAYQKLKVGIAPSMAMALAKLASGCEADTSITIDPP
jgi:hypothetical protein